MSKPMIGILTALVASVLCRTDVAAAGTQYTDEQSFLAALTAGHTTITFDDLPHGTRVYNQYGGVTFYTRVLTGDYPVELPDGGAIQGEPLTVSRTSAGEISLQWGRGCVWNDFVVYEGAIGSWYSHVPIACTTGLDSRYTFTPTTAGNSYYLVASRGATFEGPTGRDSEGTTIPSLPNACLPRTEGSCEGGLPSIYDEVANPSGGLWRSPPNNLLNAFPSALGRIAFTFDPPVHGVGLWDSSLADAVQLTLVDQQGNLVYTGSLPYGAVTFLGFVSDIPIAWGDVTPINPHTVGTIFVDDFSFGFVAGP